MGETGVLFSGSQLCTFNDDYRSQLLADCCTAQCVLSRIKPLLPSSRMKTAGRDRPPLRAAAGHAAGLPDNVTLLRPETTRSRGCHVQLGCLCFLLRPSWRRAPVQAGARHEQRALQRAFAERSEVPSAPLRKGTEFSARLYNSSRWLFLSLSSLASLLSSFLSSQIPIFNYLSTHWMG